MRYSRNFLQDLSSGDGAREKEVGSTCAFDSLFSKEKTKLTWNLPANHGSSPSLMEKSWMGGVGGFFPIIYDQQIVLSGFARTRGRKAKLSREAQQD